MIEFTVPGEPVAKGRARAFIRNGRVGHHTPEKTVNYAALVALAAQSAMHSSPLLQGPLMLSFVATFAIPKSWTKKRLAAQALSPEYVTKKPDLDNLEKNLADGMNGIVYPDDCQIACTTGKKIYGDTPGVWVSVWSLK